MEHGVAHPIMKIALTIAGSDSGGGAGIQADLKTFHQFGVFGTSVLVAITAQNTLGVSAVHAIPTDTVDAQIDAVANDLPPDAFKTGMLATAELVGLVAAAVERHSFTNFVLDPVTVATSGDRLHLAFQLVTSRQPSAEELSILTAALEHHQSRYSVDPSEGDALLQAGEYPLDESLNPTDLAAYTVVMSVILNLDETITRE